MNSNYFSPLPGFWFSALALNALVWLFTITSGPRLKVNARAAVLAITISPAIVVAVGHAGGGHAWVPLLALLMQARLSPELLILAAFNSIQFFVVWAIIAYIYRRFVGDHGPAVRAPK